MRRFSADYLRDTRLGMWADSRDALTGLSLSDRERVLDVGCGTGELTRVLREETPAEVIGIDADVALLSRAPGPVAAGDATRLPIPDDAFDLVTCQALLINLPDPAAAVAEFARVSSDLVAAIEPDNAAVAVESTVGAESALARRAREAYVEGVETDVTLGPDVAGIFADAGLSTRPTRTHYRTRIVEPPYSERDLEAARRKARASRLSAARETLLQGGLSNDEYDALVADWRSMGRAVVDRMRDDEYRRAEVVPFHVTVGRV